MGDSPKVKFAVGKKVSTSVFKSSYAHNVMTTSRDSESLECNFLQNVFETMDLAKPWTNFFTLEDPKPNADLNYDVDEGDWKRILPSATGAIELDNLRKQCSFLMEENRKLQNTVMNTHEYEKQYLDAVCLQGKIEALQWQLKEMGKNSRVYRSLLADVANFLDRSYKSLLILHEKTNPKDKNSANRAPRSRSVHGDTPPKSPTPKPSPPSSFSRFARAKSVTRSSPSTSSNRDCTWSMLRKNDAATYSASPRKSQDKKIDGVAYRRPVQPELNPNEVPADKLSEEAFRLLRTVNSLLSTREPELISTSPIENSDSSPSPTEHQNDVSLSLQNPFEDAAVFARCLSSDRSNESSSTDNDSRISFTKSMNESRVSFAKSMNESRVSFAKSLNDVKRNLHNFYPGMRRSLDANSLNSGSSKTTSEEEAAANNNPLNASMPDQGGMFTCTPSATPNTRVKKITRKGKENSSKSNPSSVSSVEDESGFSSLTSFQEVGLPLIHISPIRGYHTEIGLPMVILDKGKHRRWSSTPAEIQAMINKQRNSFAAPETAKESLSVWV